MSEFTLDDFSIGEIVNYNVFNGSLRVYDHNQSIILKKNKKSLTILLNGKKKIIYNLYHLLKEEEFNKRKERQDKEDEYQNELTRQGWERYYMSNEDK